MRLYILLVLLVAGCSQQSGSNPPRAETTEPGKSRILHLNGIDFELPFAVDNVDAIKAAQRDVQKKGCTLANDRFKLEVAGGRLKLNGQDRGAVGPGDRVVLTDDGRLTVNGNERKAQP